MCDSERMSDWEAGPGVGTAVGGMAEAAVEAAMAGITDLGGVSLAEHVGRFDAVHRTLAEALSAIDGN